MNECEDAGGELRSADNCQCYVWIELGIENSVYRGKWKKVGIWIHDFNHGSIRELR